MQGSQKDLLAGAVFIAFGLGFAVIGSRYELGTALRMGPGYFPLLLGGVLALLGIGTIVEGHVRGDASAIGPIPWRAIILLTLAVLFFAFTVRRLGLAPALVGATLLAAFSSRRTSILAALLMAVGLTALCSLIFVELLGLPVPLIGPWLRF
jgi:hypothetical protein